MKKLCCGVLTALAMVPVVAQADSIGASAHVTYWKPDLRGDIRSGGDALDLKDDLGFGDDEYMSFSAALEHPIPVLPNLRLSYLSMDQAAQGTVSTTFDGQVFEGNVQTNLDLSHFDLTMYYSVLDNWVHLDLGLSARFFDGTLNLRETRIAGARSENDINFVLPMLFGEARFELPLSGAYTGVQAHAIGYSGNQALDAAAYVGFRLVVLDLQAGYRHFSVDVEDVEDIDVDAEMAGPFVSLGVAF